MVHGFGFLNNFLWMVSGIFVTEQILTNNGFEILAVKVELFVKTFKKRLNLYISIASFDDNCSL